MKTSNSSLPQPPPSNLLPELEPLGESDPKNITRQPDKITVKDHFTIERVGDLWLLKSLAQREVEVNHVPTMASFLEGGEAITSGGLSYRLKLADGQNHAKKEKRVSVPWVELFLLALIVIGFVLWQHEPVDKEKIVVDPPPLSKTEAPIKLAANRSDAEIQARLVLNHCIFYLREYQSNDEYLHHVVADLSYLKSALTELSASSDLQREVESTLAKARQMLTEEVGRLRNNAVIARASGRSKDYQKILNRLVRVIEDPRDPTYRWALMRLQAVNS